MVAEWQADRLPGRGCDGLRDLHYRRHGGGPRRITDNTTSDSSPSYAPSGKRIAYRGYDGTDTEIYTIKANGGGRKRVTDNTADDYDPDWGVRVR